MSELVYSFLIPEIEKMSFRQKGIFIVIMMLVVVVVVVAFLMFLYSVHQRQQRHLQAAREIIQETVEHAGNHPGSLGSSQISGPSEGASSQDGRVSHVDEEQEQTEQREMTGLLSVVKE